jgi:hypothetical protein
MSEKWQPENPAPELFQTFERLELCHRVEVTEDNLHIIAKLFGWSVNYSFEGGPRLMKNGASETLQPGDWIDHRGSRWNPEPLTQGWSPAGTFHDTTALAEAAGEPT